MLTKLKCCVNLTKYKLLDDTYLKLPIFFLKVLNVKKSFLLSKRTVV